MTSNSRHLVKDKSNVKEKRKAVDEEEEAKELLRKQTERAEDELNKLKMEG